MILIRKLAPNRLTRAILALAVKSGNKLMRTKDNKMADRGKELSHVVEDCGERVKLNRRTTITVETERLLVVQRTGGSSGQAPWERDVYSSREE